MNLTEPRLRSLTLSYDLLYPCKVREKVEKLMLGLKAQDNIT